MLSDGLRKNGAVRFGVRYRQVLSFILEEIQFTGSQEKLLESDRSKSVASAEGHCRFYASTAERSHAKYA